MKFLGSQFGVEMSERDDMGLGMKVQLLGEDDENWFEIGNWFSDFWLDDMIAVLQQAKTYQIYKIRQEELNG